MIELLVFDLDGTIGETIPMCMRHLENRLGFNLLYVDY